MRFGAEDLLKKFRTPIEVAEAMILGKLGTEEIDLAHDLVTPTVIAAAEARLRLKAQGVLPSASPASPQASIEPVAWFLPGTRFRLVQEGVSGQSEDQVIDHVEVLECGVAGRTHFLMVKTSKTDRPNMQFSSFDGIHWHRWEGGTTPSEGMFVNAKLVFHFSPLPE